MGGKQQGRQAVNLSAVGMWETEKRKKSSHGPREEVGGGVSRLKGGK